MATRYELITQFITNPQNPSEDLSSLFGSPNVADPSRGGGHWELIETGADMLYWSGPVNPDGSLGQGSAPPDFIFHPGYFYNGYMQLRVAFTPDPLEEDEEEECPPDTGSRSSTAGKDSGNTVDLRTGRFLWHASLLRTAGIGNSAFVFSLNYRSNAGFDGWLGKGFASAQSLQLVQLAASVPYTVFGNDIELHAPGGTRDVFTFNEWDPSDYLTTGDNATGCRLTRSGIGSPEDEFVLTAPNGTETRFFGFSTGVIAPGQIKRQTDRYGNATTFQWEVVGGAAVLVSQTDAYGRSVVFRYDPEAGDGLLRQIEDHLGRQVDFQYDDQGRLVAVVGPSILKGAEGNTFPGGMAYVFAYDVDHSDPLRRDDLVRIWYPNQVEPYLDPLLRWVDVEAVYTGAESPRYAVTYGDDPQETSYGKVVAETVGNPSEDVGGTYHYAYEDLSGSPQPSLIDPSSPIVYRVTMTDRNGNQTVYGFTASWGVARQAVRRNRQKLEVDGVTAPTEYVTWTRYNDRNQPTLVVHPEGNSEVFEYESGVVSGISGVYEPRRGLKLRETRLPGNTLGLPARSGSGGQTELTRRYFYDPIYNRRCAVIDERGNPVDGATYASPQNGGTTPTDADRSRFATVTTFDYQKNATATVINDLALQNLLGLNATQIQALITHVDDRMKATDGSGGLPVGFQMDLGDINGDGSGDGASSGLPAAPMLGSPVRIRHPEVRQQVPNPAYPGSGDPWLWQQQVREELFTFNHRGQRTTHTDPEGNLTLWVRYPESDPEGNGLSDTGEKSNRQYGQVREIHVDADPRDVMSLLGADADLPDFIPGKIERTNTPGVYQKLVTRYESSASSGCAACAYDGLGQPLAVTDPRGFTTTYERNELGEVYRTIGPAPYRYATEAHYDANRNVIRVDIEDKVVGFESDDPTDARYARFVPTGSSGSAHEPVACACEGGHGGTIRPGWFTNRYVYDLLDDRIREDLDATGSRPERLVTTFGYDANQNLVRITRPEGNVLRYDYDERNLRIAELIGAAALSEATSPDPLPSTDFAPGAALTLFDHDGNGHLARVIAPSDRDPGDDCSLEAVLTDAFGTPVRVVHTGDWVVENILDGFDRSIVTRDALGNRTEADHDPAGQVVAVRRFGPARNPSPQDRLGTDNVLLAAETLRYDEARRSYEQQRSVFLVTDSTGGTVVSRALPSTRSVTHTGGGLAVDSTDNDHQSTATLTTGGESYGLARHVFDRAGRPVLHAEDNAALTQNVYDGANRLIETGDALGNLQRFTPDPMGNVVAVERVESCTIQGPQTIEPEIFRSLRRYDALGRLIVQIEQGADGQITDDPGVCGCQTPASSSIVTLFGYDSRNNLTLTIDPKQNTVLTEYDGASRPIRMDQHLRRRGEGTEPPPAGSTLKVSGPGCVTTQARYDGNARLVRLIDDRGGITTYGYDPLDRRVEVAWHDGSKHRTTYNEASDVIGVVDAAGSVFSFSFDAMGRRVATAITPAPGVGGTTAQAFVYDGLSRRIESTDSVGSTHAVAAMYFDSLGRVVEEAQTFDGTTRYVTHPAFVSWSAGGLFFPLGRQITWSHDALYRKKSIEEGSRSLAHWEFFGPSRVAEIQFSDRIICSYMNDTRTRSAVQPGKPSPGWGDWGSDRLGYDGSGREVAKRYLVSNIDEVTGAYSTPGNLGMGFTSAFDAASNRLFDRALHAESRSFLYQSMDESGEPVAMPGMTASGYDSLNRFRQVQRGILSSGESSDPVPAGGSVVTPISLPGSETQRRYDLDGTSNWRGTTWTEVGASESEERRDHNPLNQVTRRILASGPSQVAMGYDGEPGASNGNLTDDGQRLFRFDAFNRLIEVKRKSDDAVIGNYVYDALGRRIRKQVSNGGLTGTVQNKVATLWYSAWQQVEDTSGVFDTHSYIWGQYIDDLIYVYTLEMMVTVPFHVITDLRNTVVKVQLRFGDTDWAFAFDLDPYGRTKIYGSPGTQGSWGTPNYAGWWSDNVVETSESLYCPYIFTGRFYDAETGLYEFRSRMYHPDLGRFLQRDPLGYVDGPNAYAGYFAQFMGLDPTGESSYVDYDVLSQIAGTSYSAGGKDYFTSGISGETFVRRTDPRAVTGDVWQRMPRHTSPQTWNRLASALQQQQSLAGLRFDEDMARQCRCMLQQQEDSFRRTSRMADQMYIREAWGGTGLSGLSLASQLYGAQQRTWGENYLGDLSAASGLAGSAGNLGLDVAQLTQTYRGGWQASKAFTDSRSITRLRGGAGLLGLPGDLWTIGEGAYEGSQLFNELSNPDASWSDVRNAYLNSLFLQDLLREYGQTTVGQFGSESVGLAQDICRLIQRRMGY